MKHIASLSFGKDSLAQIIKIKELGLPLDEVVCCRIWFDDKTPGEHPLQVAFIEKATKILKERFDIDVTFIRADVTFVEQFFTKFQKGNHIGNCYGFPYTLGAWCVSRLKQAALDKYATQNKGAMWYIGIAHDEQERITNEPNKRYILNELKITEEDCFDICKPYDLISPKYDKGFRDGCWFCPKQNHASLYDLWKDYPELFEELKKLQPHSFNTFKIEGSIFDFEQRFINGYIPKRKLRAKYKQMKMAI